MKQLWQRMKMKMSFEDNIVLFTIMMLSLNIGLDIYLMADNKGDIWMLTFHVLMLALFTYYFIRRINDKLRTVKVVVLREVDEHKNEIVISAN